MIGESLITGDVALIRGMLAAIDLNDKPSFAAYEVNDIGPDRLLPHEFKPAQRTGAKALPQSSFGDCGVSTQSSRQICLGNLCATHAAKPPHPDPLPAQRGEGVAPYGATIGCAASVGWRGTTPENIEPCSNHEAGAGWPQSVCRCGSVSDQRIGT